MEKIIENISRLFGCNKSEIHGFEKIDGGMMNESFIFSLRGEKYVYRRAGEGIEKLVDRHHEKECIEAARQEGEPADQEDMMRGWAMEAIRREVNELEMTLSEEEYVEELADVIIASLSVAGKLGIDIDAAVKRKMEINKARPWKHGKETECNT